MTTPQTRSSMWTVRGHRRRQSERRRDDARHRIESGVAVDPTGQVLVADAAQQDRLLERDAVTGDQAGVGVVEPDDDALTIGEPADQRALGPDQLSDLGRGDTHHVLERVAARRAAGDAVQRGVLGHVPVRAPRALGQLMIAGDALACIGTGDDQVWRTARCVPART